MTDRLLPLGLYFIFALTTTSGFAAFSRMNQRYTFLSVLAISIALVFIPIKKSIVFKQAWPTFPPKPKYPLLSVIIGLGLWAPILTEILLTWNQDFPFGGDNNTHLENSLFVAEFWIRWLPVFFVLLLPLFWIKKGRDLKYWILFYFLSLVGISYFSPIPGASFRYPGLVYFITAPFLWIWKLFSLDNPLNAIRLVNALSVGAWLFLLRPLVIRKWPDQTLLLFGVFFFFQKDFVYFFTSSYLEPWACIFIVLAAESYFAGLEAFQVFLSLGFASLCREYSVLAWPFFWMGIQFTQTKWKDWRLYFIPPAMLMPLLMWLAGRSLRPNPRPIILAFQKQYLFSASRIQEFGKRAVTQFGKPTLFFIAGLTLLILVRSCFSKNFRGKALPIAGAWLGQFVFFYVDAQTSGFWTNYPRLHMIGWVFFGSLLILVYADLQTLKMKNLAVGLALIGLSCNLFSYIPDFILNFREDAYRNFFEHYDSPTYYPVRKLIERAFPDGVPTEVNLIRINAPVHTYPDETLNIAYPKISKKFYFIADQRTFDRPLCTCKSPKEAILGLYLFLEPLNALKPIPPSFDLKRIFQLPDPSCLKQLKSTCSTVIEERIQDTLVGTIAFGIKEQVH